MIYQLDPSGRFTGETYNRTMQDYIDTGFIPRITDIPPLPPKEGFDVVFNGRAWGYMEHESNEVVIPQAE
jgi:hypothetical protein